VTDFANKLSASQVDAGEKTESAMQNVPVRRFARGALLSAHDNVAIEDPVEICLAWPVPTEDDDRQSTALAQRNIAITMRTPGDDAALALGFLFTEGVISSQEQIAAVSTSTVGGDLDSSNRVTVELKDVPTIELAKLDRNFYMTSSCGVCGKASIEALHMQAHFPIQADELLVSANTLIGLPQQLGALQRVFAGTGSIHAAALFGQSGLSGRVYEDVGRHNAVDKLIGSRFLAGKLPMRNSGILVSGRASFELVQKARMAGCAMLAAVGAPSSLAIDLAWDSDMTLIGFLRDGRFNVYTGPDRVAHT